MEAGQALDALVAEKVMGWSLNEARTFYDVPAACWSSADLVRLSDERGLIHHFPMHGKVKSLDVNTVRTYDNTSWRSLRTNPKTAHRVPAEGHPSTPLK